MQDHPNNPIDSSFAPLQDTLIEARMRQAMAEDMQRCSAFGTPYNYISNQLEDVLYPERKAQRVQKEMKCRREQAHEEAKSLSDRKLLEEIYVALKTKIII